MFWKPSFESTALNSLNPAGPMDSGVALFYDGSRSVRIIKDKSQWSFEEKKEVLEALGHWNVFESAAAISGAIRTLVKNMRL